MAISINCIFHVRNVVFFKEIVNRFLYNFNSYYCMALFYQPVNCQMILKKWLARILNII